VQAFDGLAIAIVVTPAWRLGVVERLAPSRRIAGALLVGFAYLLAATYAGRVQGAMEALLLVAFAVALSELAADWPLGRRPGPRVARDPLAVLALGAVYPTASRGWCGWARSGSGLSSSPAAPGRRRRPRHRRPAAAAPTALAGVLVVLALPGRGGWSTSRTETFNPAGSGLGNLSTASRR
jgi:hypothetical protein